jgi:hypothetical protein
LVAGFFFATGFRVVGFFFATAFFFGAVFLVAAAEAARLFAGVFFREPARPAAPALFLVFGFFFSAGISFPSTHLTGHNGFRSIRTITQLTFYSPPPPECNKNGKNGGLHHENGFRYFSLIFGRAIVSYTIPLQPKGAMGMSIKQLVERRDEILSEMRGIHAMRPGTISEQFLKVHHKRKEEPVELIPYEGSKRGQKP